MTLLSLITTFLYISSVCSGNNMRIIGGREVDITEHPYQVQIVPIRKDQPKLTLVPSCGGTIVGRNAVLTAGHCTRKKDHQPDKYYIRAGTSYRSSKGGSLHRLLAIKVHGNYLLSRRVHSKDDISLIFVDPPFKFDKTRKAIPIAATPAREGDRGIASGWGYVDNALKIHAKKLQSIELRIISSDTCDKKSQWTGMIDKNNFCAGGVHLRSTCKGDSGGPLVSQGRLVGMVSWGVAKKCGQAGYPTVFTNVTQYIPWIKATAPGSDLNYL